MGTRFGREQRRHAHLPILLASILSMLLGTLGLVPGLLLLILGAFSPSPAFAAAPAQSGDGPVLVARARGIVNPVMAGYLNRTIAEAQQQEAAALVFVLDTPGGLDTSMREMVQSIVNSPVPVIVYVAPPGARAASAGLFITMAGHVAAMAPNTNIGSAHPVMMGPGGGQAESDDAMTDKVTNDAVALIRSLAERRGRNADWAEKAVRESANLAENDARRQNVVDVLADDVPELLSAIDGRTVELPSGQVTLSTANRQVVDVPMTLGEQVLHAITDPNVAYILMMIGVYGLIYELANPGMIFPGVVGVIALIVAFFALGTLPVNYAGVALVLFAFALLLAEVIFTPGVGILGAGGIIALILGSLLLFSGGSPAAPTVTLSPWVVGSATLATAGFFFIVLRSARQAQLRPVTTGQEALIGQVAIAQTDLKPRGMVHVAGELWEAVATDGAIPRGAPVRIERIEGLTLVVHTAREAPVTMRNA